MRTYKRYGLALNDEEKTKFEVVKKYYKKGVKSIFMTMVNAMYGRIPLTADETQGDGVNKSGIMRNFPGDVRNEETE